jgi:alpha-L-fucosidase 2
MFLRMAAAALIAPLLIGSSGGAQTDGNESAWRGGRMIVDTAGLISRSDIMLGRPNTDPFEALPLGNGRLGAAVWSEDGFTAQLNRADTMPYRYSTGQVKIVGIAALTSAPDYSGRLNLYDAAFEERGGGMSLVAYIQPKSDTLVIDVTGADPQKTQTATLALWEPRKTLASVHGEIGVLSESWLDDTNPGFSGQTFGSLAAITAEGRNVSTTVTNARTVSVTFKPESDGHFRVLVASPHFETETKTPSLATVERALRDRDAASHARWWNQFWHYAETIKVSSADGTGEYMENLRNIYLFSAAAESGGEFPGSQAGVGDLFSAARDQHQWDPAAFWHWNLRMQIAANLSAGLPELNEPYFRLYRENLAHIETWTKAHMGGAPGICIPETMRFNGVGIEFETWGGNTSKISGLNCDAASEPYYNTRTLSTGAEVSLWIWQQYQATGDKSFLATNFPVMAASARFLLSYERPGADGLLHTSPSNAHETQWDVIDPMTDLAARRALYAATIEAASRLQIEPALVAQLRAAATKIPDLPRTSIAAPTVLLTRNDDAHGQDVLANSHDPQAKIHNVENIGLEPLWPYMLIGDTSPQFELARRTYLHRPNKSGIDWSFDPVDAARLHLGDEVRSTLLSITQANQHYINGFAKWGGDGKEFYVEQSAMVALALQEALVQDYDGIIRIAPAVPSGWDFDGSVAVREGARVFVQTRGGIPITVGVAVKNDQALKIRNPWPGSAVAIRNAATGSVVAKPSTDSVLSFRAVAGTTYQLTRSAGQPIDASKTVFKPVEGTPAVAARKLGGVQIGLERLAR